MNAYGMEAAVSKGPSAMDRARHWAWKLRKPIVGVAAVVAVFAGPVTATVAMATAGAIRAFGEEYPRACLPRASEEKFAAGVLGVVKTASRPHDPETLVDGKPVRMSAPMWEKTLAAKKWVQRVKLHFGSVTDKPADQLCVKRWLAEQMKAADVRDADARNLIPVVAVLAAVPDADDLFALAVERTCVVGAMKALGGGKAPC